MVNSGEIIKVHEIKDDEQYAQILCNKIGSLNVDEENKIIDRLIEYSIENNLIHSYPWYLHQKGWIYYKKMDFKNAEICHKKVFNLFKSQNNKKGILKAITTLIADYRMNKKYDLAIEWALKGIELAEEYRNQEGLSSIKMNMAGIYMELEQYDNAKEILDELEKRDYFEKIEHEVVCYLNKAECERELKNLDEAIECIGKANKISKEYVPQVLYNVLMVKANIYVEKAWYDKAYDIYREVLLMSREGKIDIWVVETLFRWSELDLKVGKFDSAIVKLQEIEGIKGESGADIDEAKFCKLISEAYKGLEIYEKAYIYLERYIRLEKENSKNKSFKLDTLDIKKQEQIEKTYKVLYKQTEALYDIGQKITANLKKNDILQVIEKEIRNIIKFHIFNIAIYDEDTSKFKYELALNAEKEISLNYEYVKDNSFASYCINNKKDILIGDVIKEYKKYISSGIEALENNRVYDDIESDKIMRSLIFVPIIIGDNKIGIISVQSNEKNIYGIEELTTLKILSTYIGIALENARLYKAVKYSATYDVLTNIYNRREVIKRYYKLYDKGKENNFNLAVIMIDIDNFKSINDIYGHQYGDEAIRVVAKTINRSIRNCDIVGRYGGEEFIAIINNNDERNIVAIADRIRENIEQLSIITEDQGEINLTISLGLAIIDNYEVTANHVIGLADKALYEAKNTGKNKVVISNKL